MRTWATGALVGACALGWLAAGFPAWAAEDDEQPPAEQQQQKPAAPADDGVPRAKESPLGGFQFSDPPFLLPTNGDHAEVIRTIAKDLGRTCGAIEGYAWALKPEDQERLDMMNYKLMSVLRQTGRTVREVKAKSVHNQDVLVYTADASPRKMTVVWALSASGQGVVLLLCDNSGAATGSGGGGGGNKPKRR